MMLLLIILTSDEFAAPAASGKNIFCGSDEWKFQFAVQEGLKFLFPLCNSLGCFVAVDYCWGHFVTVEKKRRCTSV